MLNVKELMCKSDKFWERYSKQNNSENSRMNLEVDEKKASEKFVLEKQHLEKIISFKKSDTVVDLGAGIGLWSDFFSKKVSKVYLVEKQEHFITHAKKRINDLMLFNIETVLSDVIDFDIQENSVDYVFISGVTIYLSDDVLYVLAKKIFSYLKPNGKLIHRDAYGINERYVVDKYSDALGLDYSALYRTREEYDNYFIKKGNFKKKYDQDMYDGGKKSPYNKWDETRLRLAIYQK